MGKLGARDVHPTTYQETLNERGWFSSMAAHPHDLGHRRHRCRLATSTRKLIRPALTSRRPRFTTAETVGKDQPASRRRIDARVEARSQARHLPSQKRGFEGGAVDIGRANVTTSVRLSDRARGVRARAHAVSGVLRIRAPRHRIRQPRQQSIVYAPAFVLLGPKLSRLRP